MPLIIRTKEQQAKLDSLHNRWIKLMRQKAKIELELEKIHYEREEILYKVLGLK